MDLRLNSQLIISALLQNFHPIFLGHYLGITKSEPMYAGSEDSEAFKELRYDVKAHPIAYIGLG